MKRIITALFSAILLFSTTLVAGDVKEEKQVSSEQEIATQKNSIKQLSLAYQEPREILKQEHNAVEDIQLEKQKELQSKLDKIKRDNKEEWFLAYKDLMFEYVEWIDPPETVFDAFSEEEVILICRVVETETYDQDFDSKVNVASVVFNRLESGKFGDTITEVVTSPYQFAYGRKNITEDTILAVMYAFEIEDTTQGALYFNSFKEKKDTFCGADYIFTDGCGHHFYKPKEE